MNWKIDFWLYVGTKNFIINNILQFWFRWETNGFVNKYFDFVNSIYFLWDNDTSDNSETWKKYAISLKNTLASYYITLKKM